MWRVRLFSRSATNSVSVRSCQAMECAEVMSWPYTSSPAAPRVWLLPATQAGFWTTESESEETFSATTRWLVLPSPSEMYTMFSLPKVVSATVL